MVSSPAPRDDGDDAQDPHEPDYILGHSAAEFARLERQARLIDPITRQILQEAGIGPGMRVLDVGSGAGDVSFLVAGLVGPGGEVVGVDHSAKAVETAARRVAQAGLRHVAFRRAEIADVRDQPFDAVVGRYVLCFQPNPLSVLLWLVRLVRAGGLVAFHEPFRDLMQSVPPVASYDTSSRWLTKAYSDSGVDVQIGTKLHGLLEAAGLVSPQMRLDAVIGGVSAPDVVRLDADQALIVAEEKRARGETVPDDIAPKDLAERILEDLAAVSGVVIGRGEIGAWARKLQAD